MCYKPRVFTFILPCKLFGRDITCSSLGELYARTYTHMSHAQIQAPIHPRTHDYVVLSCVIWYSLMFCFFLFGVIAIILLK